MIKIRVSCEYIATIMTGSRLLFILARQGRLHVARSVDIEKKKMVNYSKNRALKNKTERKTTTWGFCVEKFVQFCKRTDLHGYKYIVMEDLSIMSRTIWAMAVVISIIFAAICVVEAYQWYARNPIVTVIESTQGAIWDIPFPAVTVCDLNVISRRAAKAFSNNVTLPLNVTSDFVFKTLQFAPILHSQLYADEDQKRDLHKLQDVLDLNVISIEALFKQLSPASSCSHLLDRCMWKTTMYRCEQLFQPVMLSYTLCCSFNYYAVTNDVINNGLIQMTSPRRVASCGYQTALTVMLRTDQEDYYSSTVASLGALVFIDDAYNWPDLDSPVRMVNPTSEVLIALSPERTYATPGIKAFSPEQRQCYYNDEVKIGDFNQYSFHNCMAMQKVEVLKKYCECVPFYFPMKENHRICNFHDVDCMENAFRPIARGDMSDGFNTKLHCLPECEHYDYRLEVALGKLSKNSPLSGLPFYDNINLENRSVINVFFNDLVSTRYRRDVYLNWQNILAAFGGLLSLILGFTLISGFDFIMFFLLQVAYECVSKIFSRKNKRQKSNVINVREKTVKFGATSYGIRSNFGSRQVYGTRY